MTDPKKPLREALDDWPEPEGSPSEVLERAAQERFGINLYPTEPMYTASEVKVLTEAACKEATKVVSALAFKLGRAEAAEEIADAIEELDLRDGQYDEFMVGVFAAAKVAREYASQPSQASSDATSGVPGHQEVSEAVRSPQEPPKLVCRRCNGYGLLGVAAGVNPVPCPDCALPAREPS